MSKSKGNIVDLGSFNRGADATRWLVTAGTPWIRSSLIQRGPETRQDVPHTSEFLQFHADYAALDNFDPDANKCPVESRSSLDRWVLKVELCCSDYHAQFEGWDFHKACRDLEDFVVNDLSTGMFVEVDAGCGMKETVQTSWPANIRYDVLTMLCRLIAPVSPFMVDVIHRNLTGESVHLADWPTPQHQDAELESRMQLVRNLAEAGRKVRVDEGHRQRLPCQTAGWSVRRISMNSIQSWRRKSTSLIYRQKMTWIVSKNRSRSESQDLGPSATGFTQGDGRTLKQTLRHFG